MKSRISLIIRPATSAIIAISLTTLAAQGQILWSSGTGSAWLTGTNWTGDAVPGTTDIAQFAANPTSGATGVGINFNNPTNNGTRNQAVGAIEITSARNNLNLLIGNSSTTAGANGTLTLNGATVNAVPNTVLRNAGSGTTTLTLQNTQGSGTLTMAVLFNNSAPVVDAAAGITISSALTSASGFTKTGGGLLVLSGATNDIGPMTVNAGTLQANNTGAFGGSGAITMAEGAQLRFQSGGTFTTTRAITIGGIGTGSGAITAGGSTVVNLNGGITLTTGTSIRADGGCSLNTSAASAITGSNTSLTVTLDGSVASTFNGDLSLGTGSLTKASTSTLNLNGNLSYTGATNVSGGVLSVGGTAGEILETPSITLQGGTLALNNTAGNLDRVTDTQALAILSGGGLSLTGNATTDTTETVGTINLSHFGTLSVTSAADRITSLGINSINRVTPKATLLVRGTNLDQTAATNVARITLADGGTSLGPLVGTTTLNNAPVDNASRDVAIIPWMTGDASPTGTGSGFVTYDTTLGLRVLSAAQTVELTAPYVTAATPENTAVSGGDLTLDNAAGITVNSLLLKTTAATLDSAAANPLTVASGALATSGNVAFGIGSGFSGLVLGNDEGIINVQTNTLTVNTPIHVSNGGPLVKGGNGNLTLTAANTYAGKTIHNSGTLTFNSIADVGAGASALGAPATPAAGIIDAYSGNLTYTGSGHSSDRGINLQALTSGTTISLFNSGTGPLTLGGPVTGTGTLFVRGDGGNVTLSGVLSQNGGVTHTEGQILFLTNSANSFSGNLNISRGVVAVDNIADSGVNCAIGAGSTITLGQSGFNNTGTLRFTGASGGASNRPINIQSHSGQTNGGIIENTVAGQTLVLSGPVTTGGLGTTPTLGLTGAGDGVLSSSITSPNLTITKSGAGTWTLGAAQAFTGIVNVTQGLIHFAGNTLTTNATTLGGGPAGSTATLGTSADTVVLNGNVTYSATNNPGGAMIAAGTLDLGATTRTFTVTDSTATPVELTVSSVVTGSGGLTKAGTGVLALTSANTFTGNVQVTGIASTTPAQVNMLRLTHPEALGAPDAVKTVTITGTNRQTSMIELAGGITIDANKTLNTSGKSFLAQEDSSLGSPVFLRSASGDNTWLGNVLINAGGGGYFIEAVAGSSLTIGAPATTSTMQQSVDTTNRAFQLIGGGTITLNSRLVPNGTFLTGLNKLGSGLLVIPRTDNDFTFNPNLAAGVVEVESIANSAVACSLGTGTGINLGATLRHTGAVASTSNRAIQFIGTSPTLESSGAGTLAMTGTGNVSYNNGSNSTAAPFSAGATTLTLVDVWSLMPGMTIAGRGIDSGTQITAIDYDARQITLSQPTTLATLGGRVFPTTAASTSGSNTITISATNASAANLFVGMGVTATGIPANTTITAINTTTGVITLSANLTANINSGVNINFNSNLMTVSAGNTIPRTFTLGGTNTGDNSFSPVLVNPGASTLSLVKKGLGKWILTGNNTYGGTTAVDQGTLVVNGTHTGTGAVTVAAGATLGGTGGLAAPVSAAGTLAPGASIGNFATGALALTNGATLAIEINTNTATADRVIVTGDVVVDGTVTLTLADLGSNVQLPGGTKLVLVDYSGVWDDTDIVHFNGQPVANGSTITLGANTFKVDYSDDAEPGGTAMTLTVEGTASPFQTWVANPAFGLAPADQGPNADPDGDGRSNLFEFALDGHPNDRTNNGKLVIATADSNDPGTARDLNLTLAVRNGATLGAGPGGSATLTVDGIVYVIQASANLTAWDKAVNEVSPASALTPVPSTGWTARTFRVTDSDGLPGKRFIRVGIQSAQ